MLSRTGLRFRWLGLLGMAIGLLAPSLLAAQAQPPAPPKHKPKQKQTVRYRGRRGQPLTVITPDNPDFDNEMALDFPRYVALKNYQAVRPYLVIVRNDTPRTARAYEVIWHAQVANADAPNGVSDTTIGRQSSITTPLELRHPGGIWQNDKSIPPGAARLLTPYFNGGPSEAASFGFFNKLALFPNPANFISITPELDCVVYGDGSFFGPNQSHLLLRYLVARDAQHDEALSVLRRLRSVPRDPQITSLLNLRTKIGISDKFPNTRAVPIYIHARGIAAQEFSEILTHDGYDKLQQAAEQLVASMPPHEQFSFLGGRYHHTKFRVNGQIVSPMD